jgi:hypothetical protein
MAKSVILALVIAIPLAVCLSAPTQEPNIALSIRVAEQDSPVQVVGLKMPERPSHDPLVHFRNASRKQTVRIWIEAIIAGRDGKVARIQSNSPNELWPEERAIPGGGDGWAHETVLQSARLVTSGKDLHSNCFRVTVLVLRVEFADGSFWSRDQGQKGVSWAYPSQPNTEDPCKNSNANESDVTQITGAAFRASTESDAGSSKEEIQSYQFSCHLVRRGERLVAMCPF